MATYIFLRSGGLCENEKIFGFFVDCNSGQYIGQVIDYETWDSFGVWERGGRDGDGINGVCRREPDDVEVKH
ncbi:MAG: hypothetical protein JRD68_15550 [Deltaproteobacteria bacterium]|nr:hypothetical protein [Deltaproteobacteria bacterium]